MYHPQHYQQQHQYSYEAAADPAGDGHQFAWAAYPSPSDLHQQNLYTSLYDPPPFSSYEAADEGGFGQRGSGLATPQSLYESPLFDDASWTMHGHVTDQDAGLERQHELERELFVERDTTNDAMAVSWEQHSLEPVPATSNTTAISYSPASFSPSSSVASSPLSSPPDSPPNDELAVPHVDNFTPFVPPAAPSAAYTTLTTKALENRMVQAEQDVAGSSTSSNDGRRSRPHSHPASKKAPARPNKEGLDCRCKTCGMNIAHLGFRGKEDSLNVPVVAEYGCLRCAPPPGGPGAPSTDEPPVRYEHTLSGVLDQMQGVTPLKPNRSLFRWRPRMDKEEGVLICDVCKLLVGAGSLRARDPDDEVDFGVEVVCSTCTQTYSRCSDCGGGGGPRLGVGKWRCKELFGGGRKTCQLSHLRLGSLEEMTYDCWRISDLPSTEMEELIANCKELHYSTLLQTLATPDSLEAAGSIASTYEQVNNLAVDGWTMLEPLIRQDVEPSTLKRRYIALRFSTPIPRKKAKVSRANAKRERTASANSSESFESTSGGVLRPGKKIVGFILAELDLAQGTLCLPVIMPSGSVGDTYEATTSLLQHLTTRVYADLEKENAARLARRAALLPPLKEAWTMTLFTKDPRGVNHLETRRGFSSLEKYGVAHPHSDLSRFSPSDAGFLPPELTAGWQVFVRELRSDDDWSAKLTAAAKRKASAAKESSAEGSKGKKVKR